MCGITSERPLPGLLHSCRLLLVEFGRYAVAGGIAFLLDFSILVLATEIIGLHYLVSAAIAFICGLITNYLISIFWVFHNRTLNSWKAELAIFSIIGILGLGLNQICLYLVTELARQDYRISKLVAVAVVLLWNFGMRKALLFRNRGEQVCPKP